MYAAIIDVQRSVGPDLIDSKPAPSPLPPSLLAHKNGGVIDHNNVCAQTGGGGGE